MNRWKPIISFVMAAALTVTPSLSSWAATLSDYDEKTQERLKDNVLEYDELPDLVAVYNPNLKGVNDTIGTALNDLDMSINEIEGNIQKLYSEANDMKAAGNIQGYMTYKGTADAMKENVLKTLKSSRTQMTSHTGTKKVRYAEYQLTSVAQMLMVNYQTVLAQRDMAAKAKELAEAAYQSTQTQMGLGMATEADVLSAKKSVEQAAGGLQQLDAAVLNLKQNICMMTGWSYDAVPDIREVPAVSQERLDAMNLEADIKKAIGSNQTLISQRNATADAARHMSVKEKEKRSRSISESEQKLSIEIEQLYDTVREKKAQADGAAAAYAGAVTAKQGADLKYQMGSIGRLEYLQAEVAFLTQKAAKESADMALLQAVNDYEWGVKGLAAIS